MPHLFKSLLLALAQLLVLQFPLTELSLESLDALTQSQLVSAGKHRQNESHSPSLPLVLEKSNKITENKCSGRRLPVSVRSVVCSWFVCFLVYSGSKKRLFLFLMTGQRADAISL